VIEDFAPDSPAGLVVGPSWRTGRGEVDDFVRTRLTGGGNIPSSLGVTADGELAVVNTPGTGVLFWAPREDQLVEGWDLRDVRAMALSPDGARLALCRADDEVELWDRAGRYPLLRFGLPPDARGLAYRFSPDGERLVAHRCSGKSLLLNWDLASSRLTLARQVEALECTMAPGPDGVTMGFAHQGGELRLVDVAEGRERLRLEFQSQDGKHETSAIAARVAPDGRTLVWGTNWYDLWALDLRTREVSWLHRDHSDWLTAMAFDSQGQRLFSWAHTGRNLPGHSDLLITSLGARRVTRTLDLEAINGVDLAPVPGTTRLLLLADRDLLLLDAETGQVLRHGLRFWQTPSGEQRHRPPHDEVPRVPYEDSVMRRIALTDITDGEVVRVGRAPR
jgi:WD40 repeat protein